MATISHDAANGSLDPANLVSGWSRLQLFAVGTCFILNMVDGIDILMMSYLAPAIAKEWTIGAAQLGVVFSAAIAGMMAGALMLAPVADRIGRRPIILFAIALMGGSMFASGFAASITLLIILRFTVGVGIGGILATLAAITSEYSPAKHKTMSVALLQAGYPIGAMLAGFIVSALLPAHGWRFLMSGAGTLTLFLFPLTFWLLPESLEFLEKRRPRGAMEKIVKLRQKMGLPAFKETSKMYEAPPHVSLNMLFINGRWKQTLILWASFFFCYMTLYFIISWVPRLAIEAGLAPGQAIFAGTSYNLGAFVGGLLMCFFLLKHEARRLVLYFMVAGAASLAVFGVPMSVLATLFVAFLIGVSVQGGFAGLPPLAAVTYPAEIRSTGIGSAIGIGRAGAVIGPLVGGWLLSIQTPLYVVFITFTLPLFLTGILVMLITSSSKIGGAAVASGVE